MKKQLRAGFCYSVSPMAREKTKFDQAVKRTAEIIQAHLSTLSPAQAKAMRKDIQGLALKSTPGRIPAFG
jgi:hypothetical protein